jgi:hypothetical protein
MASAYKKKRQGFIALSTLPSIDLDLAQVFPFGIPIVLFEMRLLNPRIGNFAGRLKRDVVTAQCVEKFSVQFQGTPIRPEDVRDCGNWQSSVAFRMSRMALGIHAPNFSMGHVVHIGSEQTQCHPFALCASARRASILSTIEFIF